MHAKEKTFEKTSHSSDLLLRKQSKTIVEYHSATGAGAGWGSEPVVTPVDTVVELTHMLYHVAQEDSFQKG